MTPFKAKHRFCFSNITLLVLLLHATSSSLLQVSSFSLPPPTTRTGASRTVEMTQTTIGTVGRKSSFRTETSLQAEPKSGGLRGVLSGVFEDLKFSGLAVVVLSTLLFLQPFAIINPGEVGVVSCLGKIYQIDPGLHIVNPIAQVIPFSTKTQLLDQENFVPTKEGLTVELDTSVLYKINPSSAKAIYEKIGRNYEKTVVIPEVSSAVRGLTSESDSKALYSGGGRNTLQNNLKEELSERLIGRGIEIEDVLLKNLQLPKEVTASIEAKAKAEQDSSRMEFILAKERQEAERKAVEAQGIADFQRIVSDNISPQVLTWKGIEATEKLAESSNAKIVIIGNGKDSLPLILGGSEK